VANVSVQVVVKQPHFRRWYPPCSFDWFYRDSTRLRLVGRRAGGEAGPSAPMRRARVKLKRGAAGTGVHRRAYRCLAPRIVGHGAVWVGISALVHATLETGCLAGEKAVITL
jgi:hypothetical protein